MPHRIGLVDDVRRDEPDAECVDRRLIHHNGRNALRRILFTQRIRNWSTVHKHKVDRAASRMLHNRLRMHGGCIAVRLTGLRHDIADVDLECAALSELLRDAIHEKIRHNARIEAAGTEDDRIGGADRLKRGRYRGNILRIEAHAANAPGHLRDVGLPLDYRSILENRIEAHGLLRGGKYAPLDGENL